VKAKLSENDVWLIVRALRDFSFNNRDTDLIVTLSDTDLHLAEYATDLADEIENGFVQI
jgi:hypothetical protein